MRTSSLYRYFGAALLAASLLTPLTRAQQGDKQPPHTPSEKTSEAFGKLKPLNEAKDWDGMIALLDGIQGVEPESYDRAIILDMKAKAYLQKEQYGKALEPWEAALRLSDQYKYFSKADTLSVVYYLAQIYYQESSTLKDPAATQAYLQKASAYIKRWLAETPKPTADASVFYATLLYSLGTVNPEKPDLALIRQCQEEVKKGLRTAVKPKEGFYVLLLATYQQLADFPHAAEVLEMIVAQNPNNKTYWAQLWSIYLNLAGSADKDETKARELYARAINTLERAQAVGQLKTPKDNYALVTLYFSAGQFGKATDLLYAGLKSGAIESDLKNWQILSYSYQQVNQDFKAIEVLKEAGQQFPTNGQIDFSIGLIYSQLEQPKNALASYTSAVKKGNLEKPLNAYINLAYTAYELEQLDVAKKAIEDASKLPNAEKDRTIPGLKRAIEEQIAEKQAQREAIEGKPATPPADPKAAQKAAPKTK